jgi:hypothetical protein
MSRREEYKSVGNTAPNLDGVLGQKLLQNLSINKTKQREGTTSAEASKPDMFCSIKEEMGGMSSEGEEFVLEAEAEEILNFNLSVNDKMEVDDDDDDQIVESGGVGVSDWKDNKKEESTSKAKIKKRMPSTKGIVVSRTHPYISKQHYCCFSGMLRCDVEGCGKTFTKAPLLGKHKRGHQSGIEDGSQKRFSCGVCGNAYETKNSLDSHSSTHTGLC